MAYMVVIAYMVDFVVSMSSVKGARVKTHFMTKHRNKLCHTTYQVDILFFSVFEGFWFNSMLMIFYRKNRTNNESYTENEELLRTFFNINIIRV